ncbi:MAG: hypothetical protein ABTQ29_08320 [Siculibacillus sp.]
MSTIAATSKPAQPYTSSIRGFGGIDAVKVMAAKQAKANAGVVSASSMLDEGMTTHAARTRTGISSVMLFTNSWSSSTGISGTMLDYYV